MSMKFKATAEQLQTIMANAYNASSPMGAGHFHFIPGKRLPSEFIPPEAGKPINMDYVQGRMVKLYIYPVKEQPGVWTCGSGPANIEYQSWASNYETYEDLVKSAGVTEIIEVT